MKILGINIIKEIYMPILIIIITCVLQQLAKMVINKVLSPKKKYKRMDIRKISTIKSVFCNIIKYILWTFAILMILGIFGVDTSAIIAGLGVVSLVIGLAFQDILKDILSGASILFENQFAIGDFVKINDFSGVVISLGLKTTKIKATTGEVKIISNRNINEVVNYSLSNIYALVNMPVAYEENENKVEKVINNLIEELKGKIEDISGDIVFDGIDELSESFVIYRILAECKPGKHLEVKRKLYKEFKMAFDKNNIKIPYKQIEVHYDK